MGVLPDKDDKILKCINDLYFNKDISEQDIELAQRHLESIYIRKPHKVLNFQKNSIITKLGVKIDENKLDKRCVNLHFLSEKSIIYTDENDDIWCFTPEQWNEAIEEGRNPYDGRKIDAVDKDAVDIDVCDQTLQYKNLSKQAKKILLDWQTQTYSLGYVFFKFRIKFSAN